MKWVQEKSQGPEKWKLSKIIVCYSDEYAIVDIDLLNKTISQENPKLLLIDCCILG